MKVTRIITHSIVALLLVAGAAPAMAKGGDRREVERSGGCSGNARWELKLKIDDGRLDVEYEVDQNRVGRTWRVTLRDNGNVFFRGRRTTNARSGSFTVDTRTRNRRGNDHVRARARQLGTGQLCRGRATF